MHHQLRMPQQPSHSAKWCLDQLFQHMELNLKNRTEAKTGRATSLELVGVQTVLKTRLRARTPAQPWPSNKSLLRLAVFCRTSCPT